MLGRADAGWSLSDCSDGGFESTALTHRAVRVDALGGGRDGPRPCEGLSQPRLRLRFDLAHALAADPHPFTDFLQRQDLVVLESEAMGDDGLLLLREEPQGGLDQRAALELDQLVLGIDGALIDEKVR